MRIALQAAHQDGRVVTVPSPVLVEWWRGGQGRQRQILDSLEVEPLTDALAKLAGEGLAAVSKRALGREREESERAAMRVREGQRSAPDGPRPSAIDAVVMASAAQRGDIVYTSDFDDLELLRAYFQAVSRVLRV
jgi:predicted nucleic acid-binding protein